MGKHLAYLYLLCLGFLVSSRVSFAEEAKQPQSCDSGNGVCVNKEIKMEEEATENQKSKVNIPRYANEDGRPVDAVDDCFDRHERCEEFARQGECAKNPGWMIIHCSASCNSCHLRSSSVRCGRENLNTTDTGFLVPGKLNKMFERATRDLADQYEMNVLSFDPWIVTIDNFLTDEEADALITVVGDNWERSTDTGLTNKYGETGRKISTGRTSSNQWCRQNCEDHPLVRNVIDKIVHVTTIPYRNYESFQILRYEEGQFYRAHHDTGPSQNSLSCGQRILTFFLYLSDVEEGGETSFPKLKLSVKPKKGKALFWPGVMNDDITAVDHRTTHEARPVIKGVKYAANSWIHQYDFRKANLWGCTGSFD